MAKGHWNLGYPSAGEITAVAGVWEIDELFDGRMARNYYMHHLSQRRILE